MKSILFSLLFVLTAGIAQAASVAKYVLPSAQLTLGQENKVYASGKLISGKQITNSVTNVLVNSNEEGKLLVNAGGQVLVSLNGQTAIVGQVFQGEVLLTVPYQVIQVSETYDLIEKSFGMYDVDYITLNLNL